MCVVGDADSPELVAMWPHAAVDGRDGVGSGVRTALIVDRRVRHLETQLYVNRRRRAFLARIFGVDDGDEPTTHGRRARSSQLHPGNEYFDERCRLRMLNAATATSGPELSLPTPTESTPPSLPLPVLPAASPSGTSAGHLLTSQSTTLPVAAEST